MSTDHALKTEKFSSPRAALSIVEEPDLDVPMRAFWAHVVWLLFVFYAPVFIAGIGLAVAGAVLDVYVFDGSLSNGTLQDQYLLGFSFMIGILMMSCIFFKSISQITLLFRGMVLRSIADLFGLIIVGSVLLYLVHLFFGSILYMGPNVFPKMMDKAIIDVYWGWPLKTFGFLVLEHLWHTFYAYGVVYRVVRSKLPVIFTVLVVATVSSGTTGEYDYWIINYCAQFVIMGLLAAYFAWRRSLLSIFLFFYITDFLSLREIGYYAAMHTLKYFA